MRWRACPSFARGPARRPVALRPRRDDVAVAVLRHGAAEAVLRVVGHGQQRHVRPIAGAEDPEPVAVYPVECAQVVGGGQAVLRVVHAPDSVVQPLELVPVSGRAAEVGHQPRVPLVDEVLRVTVPLVGVGHGGTAVRIDHCGAGDRRGAPRAHYESGHLDAVERRKRDLLERGVGRPLDRERRGGMARGRPCAQPQLGWSVVVS